MDTADITKRLDKIMQMLNELIGDMIKDQEATNDLKTRVIILDRTVSQYKDKAEKCDNLLAKLKALGVVINAD